MWQFGTSKPATFYGERFLTKTTLAVVRYTIPQRQSLSFTSAIQSPDACLNRPDQVGEREGHRTTSVGERPYFDPAVRCILHEIFSSAFLKDHE